MAKATPKFYVAAPDATPYQAQYLSGAAFPSFGAAKAAADRAGGAVFTQAGLKAKAGADDWQAITSPLEKKRARAAGRTCQAQDLLAFDNSQACLF